MPTFVAVAVGSLSYRPWCAMIGLCSSFLLPCSFVGVMRFRFPPRLGWTVAVKIGPAAIGRFAQNWLWLTWKGLLLHQISCISISPTIETVSHFLFHRIFRERAVACPPPPIVSIYRCNVRPAPREASHAVGVWIGRCLYLVHGIISIWKDW